jgi:hypothetical protein
VGDSARPEPVIPIPIPIASPGSDDESPAGEAVVLGPPAPVEPPAGGLPSAADATGGEPSVASAVSSLVDADPMPEPESESVPEPVLGSVPMVEPESESVPEPEPVLESVPMAEPVPPVLEAAGPSPLPPPGAVIVPPPAPERSAHRDQPVNWTPKAQARRRIFVADARGNGSYLRTTWHAEGRMFVFSVWQREVCLGAIRVPVEDAAEMVSLLMDGLVETMAAGPLPEAPLERRVQPQPGAWDGFKLQLGAWARVGAKKAATLKHLRLTTEPRTRPPAGRRPAARPRPAAQAGPKGPRHSGPHPPVPPARRRTA